MKELLLRDKATVKRVALKEAEGREIIQEMYQSL